MGSSSSDDNWNVVNGEYDSEGRPINRYRPIRPILGRICRCGNHTSEWRCDRALSDPKHDKECREMRARAIRLEEEIPNAYSPLGVSNLMTEFRDLRKRITQLREKQLDLASRQKKKKTPPPPPPARKEVRFSPLVKIIPPPPAGKRVPPPPPQPTWKQYQQAHNERTDRENNRVRRLLEKELCM